MTKKVLSTIACAIFTLALMLSWASPARAAMTSTTEDLQTSCISCAPGYVKYTKVSGPVVISKRHVTYLTNAWAQSTGYQWTTTTTATASVQASISLDARSVTSQIGVTYSTSQSYSTTVNIWADRTRYSKLTLASDFNRYYVKRQVFNSSGSLIGTTYFYLYSPIPGRQFLIVKYL